MVKTILKNRVNSGNAKSFFGYANPEPSQEYILGRCRDYRRNRDDNILWRGEVFLITGISARHLTQVMI